MQNLRYDQLYDYLFEVFPELRDDYGAAFSHFGGERPGAHCLYGDLFQEYFVKLAGTQFSRKFRQACQLLEKLAASSDFEVRCVAEVSVIEGLITEHVSVFEGVLHHLGSKTIEMAKAISPRFGVDTSHWDRTIALRLGRTHKRGE